MSKPLSALRSILIGAACTYTAIVLFLCFILTGISDNASGVVSPLNFLLVFPFSLCFSVANFLHRSPKLGGFVKFVLHLLFTVGGFFCFLYLPAFSGKSTSSSFIVLIVVAVLYLISYGTVLLFRKRWKREFHKEKEYTPLFASKESSDRTKKQ
ncbi:MAG: hypothetical protein IKC26_04515 [Clostridia bacterium]|nr:hypothetical protein [Clostridia bacterium]